MSYHRASGEYVEVSGRDVWEGVKRGATLSFFTGIAAGVGLMFTAQDGFDDGLMAYVATLVGFLVFGTAFYLPLYLAVVATSHSGGVFAGLVRFAHGLVVAVGVVAMVLVLGARVVLALLNLTL